MNPNPTTNRTMLTYPAEWSGRAQVVVYDMTGRPVFDQQLSGSGVLELRIGHLPRGVYIVHLQLDGQPLGQTRLTLQN